MHEKSTLKQELLNILTNESLSVCFQPIINLKKRMIYGYEGLIRGPSDSALHSPEKLFEVASYFGYLVELDYLCRKIIIKQYRLLSLEGKLFININPLTIVSENFIEGETLSYVHDAGMNACDIVLEITETSPIEDYYLVSKALSYYRELGFCIAIDDLGTGYSGLKLWSEMQPDFVKIDRHFMNAIDKDKIKRQFVRSIIEIASSINCHIIAEGVETADEYTTIRKLGADSVQGYYFARPSSTPAKRIEASKFRYNSPRVDCSSQSCAKQLVLETITIPPDLTLGETAEIFKQFPDEDSLAIVDNQTVEGLISKLKVFDTLSGRFGYSLHAHKPVFQFMSSNVLIADAAMPLEILSQRLTSSIDAQVDEFLITENNRFLGKGTLIDLLKKMTELRIESARDANPLTLLPGNRYIEKILEQYLLRPEPFCIAYWDLDNFKPYNDYYGYSYGDQVIKMLSLILQDALTDKDGFVGHVGGDDFILIMRSEAWQAICRQVLRNFSIQIKKQYKKNDLKAGFIEAPDRHDKMQKFPIMSLSVGILVVAQGQKLDIHRVASFASKAKTKAKKIPGNAATYAHVQGHQLGNFKKLDI